MVLKHKHFEYEVEESHFVVSLTIEYGNHIIESGKIKVKQNYGKNALQSSISIAEGVAIRRLKKKLEENKSNEIQSEKEEK